MYHHGHHEPNQKKLLQVALEWGVIGDDSRGLRQGDPLSPYLFILCLEHLGHWISRSVEEGKWKPLRASRSGPKVSHLFFADDLILFAEATIEQASYIKTGLDEFCSASSQRISFAKSLLFVSPNIQRQSSEELGRLLGIPFSNKLGTYLGHRLIHKGRSSMMEMDLVQKVRKKLEGWKHIAYLERVG